MTSSSCPFPLVQYALNDTNSCLDGCCLPCPIDSLLLSSTEYSLLTILLPLLSALSLMGSSFIILSYIVLPSFRRFPAFWIAIIAMPEAIRSLADIFVLNESYRQSLCIDGVTAARASKLLFKMLTVGDNLACGFTAAFAIFGSIASTFCLDTMNIVWNNNFIDRKWRHVCAILMLVSIYLTVRPFQDDVIHGQGTNLCFIESNHLYEYMLLPLSYTGSSAFVCLLFTLVYIVYSSYRYKSADKSSSRHFREHLKPYLPLLAYMCFGFSVYLLVMTMPNIEFFSKTDLTSDSRWIREYVGCLMNNVTPAVSQECENILESQRPQPFSLFVMRLMISLFRLSLGVVFGLNRIISKEWATLLRAKKTRLAAPSKKNLLFPQFVEKKDLLDTQSLLEVHPSDVPIDTHED